MQIWTDASFNSKTNQAGLGILIRQIIPNGVKETRIKIKTKAEDNNQAELLAIYHALQNIKGYPKNEPIYIVTDSMIAIESIKNPDGKVEKYKHISENIRAMLYCENWKIYHCKGHSNNHRVYSQRQAITDRLAKKAR